MKRIAALLICLITSAACLAGCAGSDEAFTQRSYTADGGQITEVRIEVRDRQIEVIPSDDNQIHIDYFDNSKEYYDISVSDGQVLTMSAASNKDWKDYIGGKSAAGSRKISLQLPGTHLAALKVSTTNEDISLSALDMIGDISLSSQGGGIFFDQLNAGNSILLNAKNGDILGTIIGSYDDYAISCDIKKGESSLPADKKSGTKMLAAAVNNGDIEIEFISD